MHTERAAVGPGATTTTRVVHVFGCLDRGGAETVTLDICRSIPRTEVEQIFVTLAGREGSLAEEFRAAGAEIRQCPLHPFRSFPYRMWRCLREIRPDVVVSHVNLTNALVTPVARAAGVPVRVARMWSAGDGWRDTLARQVLRAILRRMIRHTATDVLGVTAAALRLAGAPANDPRYRVLYNSVDPARVGGWNRAAARRRWGLPLDAPVLVHLGRAIPCKNRPFLIDVHRAVRFSHPDAVLVLAGPGGIADLIAAHPDCEADTQLVLAGEVDDVASVLAAADVLLLPSRREGLPGAILEALVAGVPALAADLPCLKEVADQVAGLTLLPVGAGPQCWADEAVRLARTDPRRRSQIAQSLRSSPFLLDAAVGQWRELWLR
jgi:glycosyltransferase involved in cell wall biosynthesis